MIDVQLEGVAEVTLVYKENSLKFWYREGVLTTKYYDGVEDTRVKENNPFRANIITSLLPYLVKWEMWQAQLDKNGAPILDSKGEYKLVVDKAGNKVPRPITQDSLEGMDVTFINAIIQAIRDDISPNSKSVENSPSTSSIEEF